MSEPAETKTPTELRRQLPPLSGVYREWLAALPARVVDDLDALRAQYRKFLDTLRTRNDA